MTSTQSPPSLSVVMPVHNGMPFLPLAIDSILNQTYRDFEFIIGDDGSTDGTSACLQDYAKRDSRIKVFRSDSKLGPVASSNWVADLAAGELVARMDADDLALPKRLELQLLSLVQYPKAVMAGSLFTTIDKTGRQIRGMELSLLIAKDKSPCAHTSIMYRKAVFDFVGGYASGSEYFEDADLYRRMNACGPLLIFTYPLVRYRASWAHHRLRDNRTEVQQKIATQFHTTSHSSEPDQTPRLMTLRSFMVMGLWSGTVTWRFSDLFQLCRKTSLNNFMRLMCIGLLCKTVPSFLRQSIRLKVCLKNVLVSRKIKPNRCYLYQYGEPPIKVKG